MSYKLSDFYVGVVDFFSVLLPGALLTFLFKDSRIWGDIFDPVLPALQGSIQEWAVFIVASYLLGHFVFLVASYLDHAYDLLMRARRIDFSSERAAVGRLRALVFRACVAVRRALITGRDPGALPDHVIRIRDECLGDAPNKDLINAFQWSKANLLLQYPAAAIEVQRLEADSKFFRSLVIVLSLVAITLAIKMAWFALIACTVLAILSFWGYVKRRWKSVTLAYTYYIASKNLPSPEAAPEPQVRLKG